MKKRDLLSDDDIKSFLMVCLFGSQYKSKLNDEEKIDLAINRAYRDFCRTIRNGEEWNKKIKLETPKGEANKKYYEINNSRGNASEKIKSAIKIITFKDFNTWHKELCDSLGNKEEGSIGYTYGQAQKWVNMTMKYLLILRFSPVEANIDQLHIPLDSIIVKRATEKGKELIKEETLGDNFSWSRIENYDHYWKIQNELINSLKERNYSTPILWEFDAWSGLSDLD